MYSQTHYVIEVSCMAGEKGENQLYQEKQKEELTVHSNEADIFSSMS